jgi:hypothetical protein
LSELAQVEAGAEHVTGAGDDDGLHRLVDREVVKRVRELVAERDRERVLLLGPVEGHGRDAVRRPAPEDELVAHVIERQ